MEPLVSTQWLAERLDDDDLVVLDASAHLPNAGRDAAAEFAESHIPGARFLELKTLVDPDSPVPAALPTREQFEERLSLLGVRTGDRVVLYDNSAMRTSARAWFIFRLFGVENFTVLDGGLQKWVAEGRATQGGQPEIARSEFRTSGGQGTVRDKAAMLANCESGVEQVVDARDAGRFTGETPDTIHNLPGGHIPGARNLYFADVLNEDTTFRSPTEIAAAFEKAGIDPARPVAASCGSGVTASVVLFAHHLLGHEHGALYDGSWSEWGADPQTPKETGS